MTTEIYQDPETGVVRGPFTDPADDMTEAGGNPDQPTYEAVSARPEVTVLPDIVIEAPSLQAEIETGIKTVNHLIDEVRRLFITEIAGQQTIYGEKEAEAIAYLATDPDPDFTGPVSEAAYPFLFHECASAGYTPWQACQLFLNMAAQWRPVGAQIEGLRIGASAAVKSAATVEQVSLAIQQLNEALGAFYQS